MIIVDTGFWLALADEKDTYHQAANQAFQRYDEPLITTWPVMTETCHLLLARKGVQAQLKFIDSYQTIFPKHLRQRTMYYLRSLFLLGFWSSVTLLLPQPVTAQTLFTSCLPGGADAPRSQGIVIDRSSIHSRLPLAVSFAQSRTLSNLQQLLTTEVPGFSILGNRHPALRGRRVRVLVDGVPVAADNELLSTFNPDLVERIEVIPGSSVLC